MKSIPIFSASRVLLAGLITVALASCEPDNSTPVPDAQTSPVAPPTDTAVNPPPIAPASPDPGAAAIAQPASCETANYFAEIVWEGGQPLMTFTRKPNTASLNRAPATRTVNTDSSVTFSAGRESTFYARIFPDGTCFLQVVGSNGAVSLEENGRIRGSAPASPSPISPGPVNPPVVPPGPSPRPPVQEPNQDSLSMTCPGNIQGSVDFTAYFTRESGFSRIDLRPPAGNVITTNLSYNGKNQEGQSIWRGSVAGMADVTLVHLSTAPARRGDQVSVGYDGRWGRGTCR